MIIGQGYTSGPNAISERYIHNRDGQTMLTIISRRVSNISHFLLFAAWLFLLPLPASAEPDASCVQIYYDRMPPGNKFDKLYQAYAMLLKNLLGHFYEIKTENKSAEFYQIYAILLKNLLGHFYEIKHVYFIPIDTYQHGQLTTCKTNFYLGSLDNKRIPPAYLQDFITTSTTTVWVNANINQLGPTNLKNLWGVKFGGVAKLDWGHPTTSGEPGFYRDYEYKGETFPLSNKSVNYQANPEFATIYVMQLLDPKMISYTTSWAKYNASPFKIPYILHNQNHWYIATMPFSYLEKGSYLIFCDALFDILELPPRYPGKKPALIRIEDVNAAYTDPIRMLSITNLLTRLKIPFSIALIPIFKDPLMFLKKNPKEISMTFFDNSKLYEALLYAKDHGASFIWHGVTHQYKNVKNPFNGMSGADFEFWDAKAKTPVQEDSVEYILNRLQMGAEVIAKTPIKPIAWMTPHYLASPLDYRVFGQVFFWSVGKIYYVPDCTLGQQTLPLGLTFDRSWPGNVKERMAFLGNLTVTCREKHEPIGQFFPYEIFKDYYGQRIIPEDQETSNLI